MSTEANTTPAVNSTGEPQDTLSVTDNRTGRRYELPIADCARSRAH